MSGIRTGWGIGVLLFALATGASGAVSLSSTSATVSPAAGSGTFTLTISPAAAWTAVSSNASWLTVSPASGSASGTVTFSYTANASTRARLAAITVAGATFVVTQIGTTGAYNQWVNGPYGYIWSIAGGSTYSSTNGDGGAATAAYLGTGGVSTDSNGNLYVTDSVHSSVRRVDATTGIISTVVGGQFGYGGDGGVATAASFISVANVLADPAGNLYISDSCRVRRVDAVTHVISTFAGSSANSCGYGGDGGAANAASLSGPEGLALDAAGNLYISDSGNSLVRMVSAATGKITTVAGSTAGFSGDGGVATSAMLSQPNGLAIDASGNLYISDTGNSRIRMVSATTRNISTVAGNGSYSGTGSTPTTTAVPLPTGLAVDRQGNLYIAISYNQTVVELAASAGTLTTVAGTSACCVTNGSGVPALQDAFSGLNQMAVDGAGNLYFSAAGRVFMLDQVTPQIALTPVATSAGSVAGTGSTALTTTPTGSIWIASSNAAWLTLTTGSGTGAGTIGYSYTANNSPWARTGLITVEGQTFGVTQAGDGASMAPTAATVGPAAGSGTASLTLTGSMAWTAASDSAWLTVTPTSGSGTGTVTYSYAANTSTAPRSGTISAAGVSIRVTQTGTSGVSTVWGTSANGFVTTIAGGGTSSTGTTAATVALTPHGVGVDANGNVYVTESYDIRKVTTAGAVSTLAGGGNLSGSAANGSLATAASVNPGGIAVDAAGDVYFNDGTVSGIRRIDAHTGILSTVAGGQFGLSGDGGPATAAALNSPGAIALDGGGNLYICDVGNRRVRRVDASTGYIATVAGSSVTYSTAGDGGAATAATFSGLNGIAADGQGNLYIADSYEIRRVDGTTGIITKLAALQTVVALATDPAGRLYAATYNLIYLVNTSTGALTQVAGEGSVASAFGATDGGDGGPALNATFASITGLATDGSSNLYVTDAGGRIRFIDMTTAAVTPGSASATVATGSGTGSVAVTLPSITSPWFAASNAPWLTLTAASGLGSGSVGYSFTANVSVFARQAVVTVGGQSVVVTQPGSTVALGSQRAAVGATAGTGTVAFTVTPAAPWTAVSSAAWLTVSPASGTAGTTLTYTFTANTAATARIGTITVAGRRFGVNAAGGRRILDSMGEQQFLRADPSVRGRRRGSVDRQRRLRSGAGGLSHGNRPRDGWECERLRFGRTFAGEADRCGQRGDYALCGDWRGRFCGRWRGFCRGVTGQPRGDCAGFGR